MLLLKNKNYHLLLLRLCNRLYTVPIELPSASGFEYGLYLGHWFTIGYVIPLTELLGWLFSCMLLLLIFYPDFFRRKEKVGFVSLFFKFGISTSDFALFLIILSSNWLL